MPHTLLIVDDDTDLLSILRDIFTEENYAVTTCSDGLEAIRRCQDNPFDLIITDIMLPGASGIDILKKAKEARPETLVILITGYASLETAINAIREGAYDYITKPFKLEQIKLVVQNGFEKISLVKENRRLLKELEQAYEELRLVKHILGTKSALETKDSIQAGSTEKTLISDDLTPHLLQHRMRPYSDSFLDDLERISLLRDKGLITTREFEICKAKLFQHLR